jgi:hypothetical protein
MSGKGDVKKEEKKRENSDKGHGRIPVVSIKGI